MKVGDEVNDEETRLSIQALFKTGFFQEVSLSQDGSVLVVVVVERPSIASITFKGNSQINDEALMQGLEQAEIIEGRIFNIASMETVEQDLKNSYLSMGRYSATVTSAATELDDNRVDIVITINEGRVARIRKINIIGAETVPLKNIKDEMELKETRGFKVFSRQDQYSKQKLEADLEAIRSYYLNRGYYEFEIVSSNVEISPNKQNIFIGITIDEGAPYTFGEPVIEGIDEEQAAELRGLVSIRSGQSFSRQVINESRLALTDYFVDDGFAFVEVRSVFENDEVAKTVNVVFSVIPNHRVYVRRIDISGNTYTRDEVVRRELRQLEGSWYSAAAVKRSRDRLKRLGIFGNVTVETPPVAGTTDQVDMKVVVSELDTGSILASAGYSDEDGPLFGIEFEQRNLLGTGKNLSVKLNDSDAVNSAVIAYTNPYYTHDGISRGFSLSTRKVDSTEVDTAAYILNTSGFGVLYKIPIAETNTINFGISFEQLDLKTTSDTPQLFIDTITKKDGGLSHPQERNANDLLLTTGLSKDTRDDFFFPNSGSTRSLSVEGTLPGSDFEYYKLSFQSTQYLPVGDRFTIKSSLDLGYGSGFGDSKELPFFKNYFAGGARSVRGFEARALGPRALRGGSTAGEGEEMLMCPKSNTCEPIGGSSRILANLELLFPAFGGGDSNDKRIGIFMDAGMVYGDSPKEDTGSEQLRLSTGLFFNWYSAVGPFSISYGIPLNDAEDDEKEELQISVGTVFR